MLKTEVFRLSDVSRSFATRMKGEELGSLVSRDSKELPPGKTVVVDWSGVVAVSPSFVDEFVKTLDPLRDIVLFSGVAPSISGLVEKVSRRRAFPVRYLAGPPTGKP